MLRAMLAGVIFAGFSGPVMAFDFGPDDFAVKYAEEAKHEQRTSIVHLKSCDRKSSGGCSYQGDGDSMVSVLGSFEDGKTKTIALLLTADTPDDRDLMHDAPFILTAIASPTYTLEERKALILALMPTSIADGQKPKFAMLGSIKYTAAVLPGNTLAFGAIDTSQP